MLKKKRLPKKWCGSCKRMRYVKPEDRCPKLLSCIVYARQAQEFGDWLPDEQTRR